MKKTLKKTIKQDKRIHISGLKPLLPIKSQEPQDIQKDTTDR